MKPILFNTEMVGAILDGSKTMTRRVCKELDNYEFSWGLDREPYIGDYKTFAKVGARKWDWVTLKDVWLYDLQTEVDDSKSYLLKPPYQLSDILWVRETWCEYKGNYLYKADAKHQALDNLLGGKSFFKWKPSIHMPREAARIFLRVTGVRVERLGDITIQDMIQEGVKVDDITTTQGIIEYRVINRFEELWNSTIKKKDLYMCGFDASPWVWVIEFERMDADGTKE